MRMLLLAVCPVGLAVVLACAGGGAPAEPPVVLDVDGCEPTPQSANQWRCSGAPSTLRGPFARALLDVGAARVWWPTSWHSTHDVASVWQVGDALLQLTLGREAGGTVVVLEPVTMPYTPTSATTPPWYGVGFVDIREQLPGAWCAIFDEPSHLAADGTVEGPHLEYGSEWSYQGQWTLDEERFEVRGAWSPEEGAPSADQVLNHPRGVPRADGWVLLGDTHAFACGPSATELPLVAETWVLMRDGGGGAAEVERVGRFLLDVVGANVVVTTGPSVPEHFGIRIATHADAAFSPSAPVDRLMLDSLAGALPALSRTDQPATLAPLEVWVGRSE